MNLALWMAVAASIGFVDLNFQATKSDRAHSALARSLSQFDKPSERTMETLTRQGLNKRYKTDPTRVLASLERTAQGQKDDADLIYALAELNWLEGRRHDQTKLISFDRQRDQVLDRYLDALTYAYDYLFSPALAAGRQPSDPRFRLACDIYNAALERLIRTALVKGRVPMGESIELTLRGQKAKVRLAVDEGSPWPRNEIGEMMFASDYELTGVETQTRQYGVGVPMIALRKRPKSDDNPAAASLERFLPSEAAFPLTAFMHPKSRLEQPLDKKGDEEFVVELIDPIRFRQVGSDPKALLPLEFDLTTPLAYMWSKSEQFREADREKIANLIKPGDLSKKSGLTLLRPYEPGKIPVVMVHGLASSPLTWIPMINELLNDPRVRENYQFMLFAYPTGAHVPIAMSSLREALWQARTQFNTEGAAPDFDQMVLLGHSMGGLLCHSLAVSSGDRFWQLHSDRPFKEILGPPEVLTELRQFLFFEPMPSVRRVVYLATPHRGSDLSRGMIGRVSSSLIEDSDHIQKLLSTLIADNPDAFDRKRFRRLPNSIETLSTNNPVLTALMEMKSGPDVTFHSIIGANRPGPPADSTDGVVAYRSSHLDGLASEKLVRSDHSVQKSPEAIQEVRRVLIEHLVKVRPAAGTPMPAPVLEERAAKLFDLGKPLPVLPNGIKAN
ncbi:MAG: alpha/beta fold hydrolase [Planctomycetota bacterium]